MRGRDDAMPGAAGFFCPRDFIAGGGAYYGGGGEVMGGDDGTGWYEAGDGGAALAYSRGDCTYYHHGALHGVEWVDGGDGGGFCAGLGRSGLCAGSGGSDTGDGDGDGDSGDEVRCAARRRGDTTACAARPCAIRLRRGRLRAGCGGAVCCVRTRVAWVRAGGARAARLCSALRPAGPGPWGSPTTPGV